MILCRFGDAGSDFYSHASWTRHALAENDGGAATLCALYRDAEFDPTLSACYYQRVTQPETPRWSTYDWGRIPESERPPVCINGQYPEMITERAWTSPICYWQP